MKASYDIADLLKTLLHLFDDLDHSMGAVISLSEKYDERLKSFEGVDFTEQEIVSQLSSLPPERLAVLLEIFKQLDEFSSRFKPMAKEKIKEFEDFCEFIKNMRANLHKVLDEN